LFGDGQHGGAEIQGGHLRAAPAESEGHVSRAAADIQGAVAGLDAGHFDQGAFPTAVQTQALQIVDEIVAGRDNGEKVFHLGGALFSRLMEFIGLHEQD
jgi:hypothetical protein